MLSLVRLAIGSVLCASAAAAPVKDVVPIDHETWAVIGWNDGCGVAFEHFAYPKLGAEIASDPISTRIGTAVIPPGREKSVENWALEADGSLSWDQTLVENTRKDLKAGGFVRAGYVETIRDDAAAANRPRLAQTLLSTTTLSTRLTSGWPGPEWRWAGAGYSPLGTCALLAFARRAPPSRYRLLLVRVYNPRARGDRAYAHASNARLLFEAGDLDAAAAEAATAAGLAPDLPIARYERAAMLALTGNANEAVDELTAAIKLEPRYAAKALDDPDFSDLKEREDFRQLTAPPP
ncbi:MAG: TPR end-of-group domain-containing protein [Elusimicrobiota bacterium]